jgi:UDP-2,3-diacylglucosamine hydrolase
MGISYFASDFHLGAPDKQTSLEREKSIVAWLAYAARDATDIYLVGDVQDCLGKSHNSATKAFNFISFMATTTCG